MPGGLIQLVNKGAQDQLVTGQPSFTHFKSMYKRHTEFAMEHFRLNFRSSNLDLGTLPKTMRLRVDRNAQLVHDMYIHVRLPDIFSPVRSIPINTKPQLAPDAKAIGYEFRWIRNIGYNMIRSVSILINGTAIVTHTGEWLKLYSYMTHDSNRRKIIDEMIGNVPELYDPANAFRRHNQYPHAITGIKKAEPSILGRNLVIPLHFWFCEHIGQALPLIALQYSEVEIVVEFATIYDLFTIRDIRLNSPTFGKRIKPDATTELSITNFLSVPLINTTPTNLTLTTWSLNPYIEANYIFLSDTELINLAKSDTSFIIRDVRFLNTRGLYGGGNDIELTLHNLCTRIVWVTQRSDVEELNGYDNYTNIPEDLYSSFFSSEGMKPWYSSGTLVGQNQSSHDIIIDGTILLDGAERFTTKPSDFFELQSNYKHSTGYPIKGIYSYSFALDHTEQPSGHINGSMFNRTLLRLTLQLPPFTTQTQSNQACIIKSTVLTQNPIQVQSTSIHNPDNVLTIISKPDLQVYQYTYSVRSYVESYNFLRIARGIANVVFSS